MRSTTCVINLIASIIAASSLMRRWERSNVSLHGNINRCRTFTTSFAIGLKIDAIDVHRAAPLLLYCLRPFREVLYNLVGKFALKSCGTSFNLVKVHFRIDLAFVVTFSVLIVASSFYFCTCKGNFNFAGQAGFLFEFFKIKSWAIWRTQLGRAFS